MKIFLQKEMNRYDIFNNVYGIARSSLALSLLITLTFTPTFVYFPKPYLNTLNKLNSIIPNYFFLFEYSNLNVATIIACIILVLVISGYLPQVTGILHAWIAYSFFTGSLMVEGGDQIAQILTLLILPITIFDKRINHWSRKEYFKWRRPFVVNYFSYSCSYMVKIQMSVLYFFAVTEKLNVPEWIDGSAFYYWFNDSSLGASSLFQGVIGFLFDNAFITSIVTWGVLALEILLFGALFMNKEHKLKMFILGVGFHFTIVIIHGLFSFFFAMLAGLILYLLPLNNYLTLKDLFKNFIDSKPYSRSEY
ncbi:MAG: hypothetical protein GDA51_03655 [Ekhidna sp.]|nr:hypothetical protein [Ekhidna sp.]